MNRHRFTMLATAALVPVALSALSGCSSSGTQASGLAQTGQVSSSATSSSSASPASVGTASSSSASSASDDSSSADTGDSSSTDSADSPSTADSSSTSATDGSTSGGTGGSAAFCASWKQAVHDFDLYTANQGGIAKSQVQTDFQTAQAGAPDAVKDDVTQLAAFYQSALTSHGKGGMTPQLAPAEQDFSAWVATNC